jgi:hypothetical protein
LPPLPLEPFERVEKSWHAETLESWKLLSDLSCADYARKVLASIQEQNFELVEAGFMDLSGECWGCVFKGAQGEALSVLLMPLHLFSPRSESNVLTVTVLHYLAYEEI